ncbi:MAG: fibronectin type III domain-containing protein [Oscillospiraceae bacterium]|jgi:hypothetical protein|nr:fibronectin type III domain-containing protein [Oscillospiraceae bacterium]
MKKRLFSTFMAVFIAFTAIPGITAGAATKKISSVVSETEAGVEEIAEGAATKKISSLKISKISNQAYTGKSLKPGVTVKDGSKTLKSGRDYTLSYSKNKNIGKASVKIKGKGNYTGSKTVTFKIVPKKAAISSISESKQKIKLKWGKVSGSVTGYKVYYSEKKSGDYKLLKTVKGASTVSYTTKKLDSGTTYYFRVRAYKTVSGADYTGANSAVKSKKTSGTTASEPPSANQSDEMVFHFSGISGGRVYGVFVWLNRSSKPGKTSVVISEYLDDPSYGEMFEYYNTEDVAYAPDMSFSVPRINMRDVMWDENGMGTVPKAEGVIYITVTGGDTLTYDGGGRTLTLSRITKAEEKALFGVA